MSALYVPAGPDAQLAQLGEAGELRASGVLTEAEFEAQKKHASSLADCHRTPKAATGGHVKGGH